MTRGSDVTPSGMDRERWLQSRLQGGVGMVTRDAARQILGLTNGLGPADRAVVVEALHRMVDETNRWKDAWAHAEVDKDHKVREAMQRSESCSAHGDEIRGLKAQVAAADERADRTEKGRLVLLGWLQACRDLVTGIDRRGAAVHPSGEKIAAWMRTQVPRVSDAHMRAWNPATPAVKRVAKPKADSK